MKRVGSILFCLFLLSGALSSCGNSDHTSSDPTFTYSMNFYQEEFEAEYSHYEKALPVSKDNSEILITGQTSSGKIDVEIICMDGDDQETYTFEITGVTEEKITLSDKHSLDWTAFVNCYSDTEGAFKISVN